MTADVLPFTRRPQGYQHLIRITQAHLGVAETRCGRTVEIRPATEVDGLPICTDCSPSPTTHDGTQEVPC